MNKTVEYFVNELNKLKETYVSTKNIKEFSDKLDKIKDKIEKEELSEKDFNIIKKHLLNLSDFLQEKNIKRKINLKDIKNTVKNIKEQDKTIDYFIKKIEKLKETNISAENIKEFADKFNKIKKEIEEGNISDKELDILNEKLFNLAEHLEKKKKKEELDKKLKKRKKITVIPEKISPIIKPNIEIKEPEIIKQPEVTTISVPLKSTIGIEDKNLLGFKKQFDERIENIKKIKRERTENEIFNHFIDELNDIMDKTLFSFEVEDLRESYKDLKILENNVALFKDNLSLDEYNILKKEIIKFGKYLQSLLLEKGVKFKKGKAILKEETLKGKVKKFIKEQKFEGAGGLLFALTDSPLLMILGKQVDEFFEKRREKKQDEEKRQIEKLSEIYKNKPVRRKQKAKSIKKEIKEKKDIVENTLFPQIPVNIDKELESDDEYKKMVSDLKLMAEESAKELELSEDVRGKISSELKKIPENIDITEEKEKYDHKNKNKIKSEKKIPTVRKKREQKEIDYSDDVYEILKTHLPEIDENIEKLTKNYREANEEQKVTERDETLKNISKSLSEKGKEIKKEDKDISKKGIKSLIPHIGIIGKVLAGTGAFGIGWVIGKELNKYISPFIQDIVDSFQGTVDDYYKKSLKLKFTESQRGEIENLKVLKEKLGITKFTRREIYESIQKDPSILKKLNEKEKKVVMGMVEKHKQQLQLQRKEIPLITKEKPIKSTEEKSISKTTSTIEKPKKVKESIDMTSFFSNIPFLNKSYENFKTQNIEKFESEKSDNIINTSITKPGIKIQETKNIDMSSISPTNKNVDIQNLNSVVKENFLQMATEYKENTGKSLPVNSAFRSSGDQERLYRKYPGKAAKPGTSMHEKGIAVDVNTVNVNEMKSTGLLKKYGFDTPVRGETWHIEPTSVRKEFITNMNQDMSQIGENTRDRKNITNMNQEGNAVNNSNMVFAQNNYVVTPQDFRTFIDDPFLFQELRNNYG